MKYQFVKMISRLICLLPDPVCRMLGRGLGLLFWLLVPRKRKKMATENMMRSLSLDEEQAIEFVKRSCTRFGPMFLDVLRLPTFNKNNMKQYVHLEGEEYLTEALSHGKGAILATSHSGNWEFLGAALAMRGFPLASIAQKQSSEQMDRFINEYRTMTGMKVIYKTGVRDMIKLLGEGYVIGILMDQDAHRDGVMVDFFGRSSSTPQGAAALGRLKDAPIIPIFMTENKDGTHTGILHPPVWVEKTSDRDHDILITTQQLTRTIEGHIRKYPHEWFWLHNRWKNSPPMN